ncbi:hypothetical protein COW98_05220 [Candidatus Roizmanbacteria bacterium CG22_combo_CG10-13_8_21_14_all_35_9]|uniref:DUF4446 domain-containing protein n=4 Tax=Candidatus Roizmaniibacteriota TaxID=1752723 RepID=A0A2M8F1N0_9BACT|nr:MAG: hypothetical protein COX47_03310 [Candidatus Roizmanbacteria bacterium CG23_combo_of_CG06-09_8_20_14_all_35_49]PIP62224.1 MAG: hypothetical protein COW98_05220 [Candidatus Roizmanbacteria bacterium CG22_combo_CG10-13_8_21_14_all_35_9]PIY71294.1 MAG: hypothetical protein COY88_01125 [Candidatus Roizmanbacteria bacterium CG_4_10_14_0_8_um_filter_35_28]PJC33160.1 MAG: hypothetical protein CO048_03690 [Candidatus Roizmanbacteria bacterium CG_4_9_14_0_2_um_filter_35_15]PJC82735.1 MAG: hypoth
MIALILEAIFFIWLIVITAIILRLRSHYYNLTSRTKKDKIDDILDSLLDHEKKIETEIEKLKKEIKDEIANSRLHVQKIGLVRFNPFERIGGEQSFIVAFLDKDNNGITLNFIYTREGIRVYTKRVKQGKGVEYELSEEEKKAIEKSS